MKKGWLFVLVNGFIFFFFYRALSFDFTTNIITKHNSGSSSFPFIGFLLVFFLVNLGIWLGLKINKKKLGEKKK